MIMNKFWSFHYQNIHVKLLIAALLVVLMVVNSECRPIAGKEVEEEEDKGVIGMMKWASRDEMVYVAGYGEDKLSTLLITGTLLCNKTCLGSKHGISNNNHHLGLSTQLQPISGALVGAKCDNNKKDQNCSWTRAVTDKYGEFIIDLPSHLHSITNLNKVCSITILHLPLNSICRDSIYSGNYFDLELLSIGNGIRTYTTGKIEIS
ncbi:unnamed protein product [Amaranthus hypochondriacus]